MDMTGNPTQTAAQGNSAEVKFEGPTSGYRVVYGENWPTRERIFPTKRKANAFAKQQERVGDVVFSVKKVVAGEPPQSITAALAAAGT
jgi:hypothetical protein